MDMRNKSFLLMDEVCGLFIEVVVLVGVIMVKLNVMIVKIL